jgi:hypothetical protein
MTSSEDRVALNPFLEITRVIDPTPIPDEPELPASGLPRLVLAGGVMSGLFAVGTLVVHIRHPIDGVLVFLIPILVLSLLLIGIYLKWTFWGGMHPPIAIGEVPQNVPGPWYPYAILAIFTLLCIWMAVYIKLL